MSTSTDRLTTDVFKRIPLFEDLTDAECRQFRGVAQVMEFEPGEHVLRQGRSSRNLWVVLDGICEVVKEPAEGDGSPIQTPIVLAVLEPYHQFGEMSFFRPAPHSASVRAKTPVKLLRIERGDYERMIEQGSPAAYKLACKVVESLADRLQRMDEWVAKLTHQVPPTPPIGEWENFRKKLFNSWNL